MQKTRTICILQTQLKMVVKWIALAPNPTTRLFQNFPNHDKTIEWAGLRPMSPDGVGIMGPTRVAGLYLTTGHGHLGWTMAPGAGKLVADCVAGQGGEIPLDDYQLTRF